VEWDDSISIRLLGPIAVARNERELYIGPARQREVLAVLAFHAGHVVSVGDIAAAVWGERQPRSVENLVHTYVGRLRGALDADTGVDVLRSNRPGYTLAVDPRQIDVTQFEQLVRRARCEAGRGEPSSIAGRAALRAAAAGFRSALGLWCGPALPETTGPVAEAERARLTEMQHEVTEELMRVRLQLGDVRGLVPELKRMVIKDPLRERLWALLLLVLGRTSRTAEALAVYHEARSTLSDRLGVEPGYELQRLYRSLLRGEPMALEPTAPVGGPDER
jgi:DNA-binding SARP family transcriptional activator